jgi:hypothetical protein
MRKLEPALAYHGARRRPIRLSHAMPAGQYRELQWSSPRPAYRDRVRSLRYAEMTTSPAETCGAEVPRSGRFSRIQFAAALFDSFAPASLS